jgi:hypothetical protein
MSERTSITEKHYLLCLAMHLIDKAFKGPVKDWSIAKGFDVTSDGVHGNLAGFAGEEVFKIFPAGWNEGECILINCVSYAGGPWIAFSGVVQNSRLLGVTDLPFTFDGLTCLRSDDVK